VRLSAFVLIAGLAVTSAACGPAAEEGAEPDTFPAVSVATGSVQLTEWTDSVEVGGVFRSRVTAVVASRILAPVVAVRVRAGDRVRRGDVLIELDAAELRAQAARAGSSLEAAERASQAAAADVGGAEAMVELAQATYERIRQLHEQRSATAQELDEATAGLTAAQARLTAARAQAASAASALEAARSAAEAGETVAAYGVLTAPFDAVVAERRVDPGSMATPGTPLLVLEEPGALRLEVQLDAARASAVRTGMAVGVRADADGVEAPWVDGRVSEIARVDAASHSFAVKIDVEAPSDWRSGWFGRARFAVSTRQALTMPADALVRRGQLTMSFVVASDGVARLRAIRIGDSREGRIEVLSGLAAGDTVVVDPPAELEDGRRVTGGAGR